MLRYSQNNNKYIYIYIYACIGDALGKLKVCTSRNKTQETQQPMAHEFRRPKQITSASQMHETLKHGGGSAVRL